MIHQHQDKIIHAKATMVDEKDDRRTSLPGPMTTDPDVLFFPLSSPEHQPLPWIHKLDVDNNNNDSISDRVERRCSNYPRRRSFQLPSTNVSQGTFSSSSSSVLNDSLSSVGSSTQSSDSNSNSNNNAKHYSIPTPPLSSSWSSSSAPRFLQHKTMNKFYNGNFNNKSSGNINLLPLHNPYGNNSVSSTFSNGSSASPPRYRASTIGPAAIVQRSGSKSVKSALVEIERLCHQYEEEQMMLSSESTTSSSSPPHHEQYQPHHTPPLQEIQLLYELSVDSYYRVILRKYNGVEILQRVLKVYGGGIKIASNDSLGNSVTVSTLSSPSYHEIDTHVHKTLKRLLDDEE